jgi:hypothetical protein
VRSIGRRGRRVVVAWATALVALTSMVVPANGVSSALPTAAGVAPRLPSTGPSWPSSIAGRKVLDQDGNVYLIRTFSSWGMASNLSDADITRALEGVAADGFNGVTVWIGGGADYGPTWSPTYRQKATGQDFWTGTPWASSLGPAWSSLDHLVSEAARLGIVVWMSLNGGNGSYGARADWEGVTDADMRDAGAAVAARYRSAPNIGWHVMLDDGTLPSSVAGERVDAFFAGVNATEGAATRPVRWMEVANGSSTDDQGWLQSTSFDATIDAWYDYRGNSTEIAESGYASAPEVPVGDSEPPYDGAPHYSGNQGQQLRERSYAVFLEGGSLINYGQEDWWTFGLQGLYSEGLSWQQVPTHSHTVQQSFAWALLDQFVADRTWVPDNGSFLTTGTGSGETKAAAGRSGTAGVVYFPSTRSVVVNTTILGGTGQVRLRWFDPTTGAYTDISSGEAPQANRAVPYPAAHADGSSDWVLVLDRAGAGLPPTTSTSSTTTTTTTTQPPTTTTTQPPATTRPPVTSTTTTTTQPPTTTTATQPPTTTTRPPALTSTTTTTTTTRPPTTVPASTAPPASTDVAYHAVDASRLMDTRPGTSTVDGQAAGIGTRTAGSITAITVTGRAGVPTDATAAVLNITVTDATQAGFVTAFPCGAPIPLTSNLNYAAGQTTPNAVFAEIGDNGRVCLYTSGATHLIADLNGYFN